MRERNMNVWLPLARPLLGTWPETQACVLNGNGTTTLGLVSLHAVHAEPHQTGLALLLIFLGSLNL